MALTPHTCRQDHIEVLYAGENHYDLVYPLSYHDNAVAMQGVSQYKSDLGVFYVIAPPMVYSGSMNLYLDVLYDILEEHCGIPRPKIEAIPEGVSPAYLNVEYEAFLRERRTKGPAKWRVGESCQARETAKGSKWQGASGGTRVSVPTRKGCGTVS